MFFAKTLLEPIPAPIWVIVVVPSDEGGGVLVTT
jgi:hypothetical protein